MTAAVSVAVLAVTMISSAGPDGRMSLSALPVVLAVGAGCVVAVVVARIWPDPRRL